MCNRRQVGLGVAVSLGIAGAVILGAARPARAHGHGGGYVVASGPSSAVGVPSGRFYDGSMYPYYAAQHPELASTPLVAAPTVRAMQGYAPATYAPQYYYAAPRVTYQPVRWVRPRLRR